MNNPEDSLGGRLPLLGKTELDGAQSTLYKAMEKEMLPWAKKSGFQAATVDGRLLGPSTRSSTARCSAKVSSNTSGPSANTLP